MASYFLPWFSCLADHHLQQQRKISVVRDCTILQHRRYLEVKRKIVTSEIKRRTEIFTARSVEIVKTVPSPAKEVVDDDVELR
jgi:hypothetical protein